MYKLLKLTTSTILLSLLSALSVHAQIEGPVHIYGLQLEYRFKPNETDQYNRFMSEMSAHGFTYEVEYLSLARAWRNLAEDKNSCIFPTSIPTLIRANPDLKTEVFIESDRIDNVVMRALVLPGEPQIKSLEDMNGKSVALWNGLSAEHFLPGVDAVIELTNTTETRVRMLNSERVDVIISFIPDVQLASIELGFPVPIVEGALELITGNGTHLVCHDTPFNRLKIEQFDKILADFKAAGQLREFFGPHAVLY